MTSSERLSGSRRGTCLTALRSISGVPGDYCSFVQEVVMACWLIAWVLSIGEPFEQIWEAAEREVTAPEE